MHAIKKINTRLAFIYYLNGKKIDKMVRNDIACNCILLERIAFLVRMHLISIVFCNSACFNVAAIWDLISFLSAFGCFLKYASEYKMHTPMYGKICILNANSEDLKCGSSSGSVLFIRIKMTFKDRNTSNANIKNSTSDHLKYILGTGL